MSHQGQDVISIGLLILTIFNYYLQNKQVGKDWIKKNDKFQVGLSFFSFFFRTNSIVSNYSFAYCYYFIIALIFKSIRAHKNLMSGLYLQSVCAGPDGICYVTPQGHRSHKSQVHTIFTVTGGALTRTSTHISSLLSGFLPQPPAAPNS